MTPPHNAGGNTGDFRAEDAVRAIAVLVVIAVVLGIGFTGKCRRDPPNARWNRPPDPWEADPRVVAEERRREEEARRKFAEERERLRRLIDDKEQRLRTFNSEDKYRDAVHLGNEMTRAYSAEATRLDLTARLQSAQQAAVRAASSIAKTKAVRLVGQDRYADAARVIEELIADAGPCASACGLNKELEDLYRGYLFVRDVAKAADGGTK